MKPKFRNVLLYLGSALLSISYAHAASGTWTDAAGNWSDGTKWSGSIIADGADANANFTFNFTGTRTITLDSSRIIGNIIKTDPSPSHVLTIAASGGSILTLSTTSGTPTITNNDVGGGGRMDISAQVSSTQGLTKEGNGFVYFSGGTSASSSWSGNTTVSGGILHLGGINLANIGGGSGRNISVAADAGIGINTLNNAALNRIVETTAEISVLTGGHNNALDFSSGTGATLNNAFLGSSFTNGGKAELGGIITMANNYRLGAPSGLQNGTLGIKDTSLLSGSNGLIIGGNRVVIVGNHTFTGDTTLRDGARLGLAGRDADGVSLRNNSNALQNSVLDLGGLAATGQIFLEAGTTAGPITGATTSANGATKSATFGGLKGSRNLYSAFLFTGPGNNTSATTAANITGFTLNPGTGVTASYSGAIGGFGVGASGSTGGASTLTKSGDGIQFLEGVNTYTGATTISGGNLALGTTGSIATSASVTIGAGGTLDTSGQPSYAIPASQPLTFGVDPAGSGSAGKIMADGLDITNAVVTLSPVATLDDAVYVLATYLSLNGTEFDSVTGVPLGYEIDYNYNSENKIALVSTGAPGGFAAWQSANSTGGALDADHDNDGVSNGVEYFLGGTTNTTGFTALPGVTNTGGTLSVTWTKAATYPVTAVYGTDFAVETSATLTDPWTTETLGVNVTVTGDDVKYTFPAGTKNFARLKVTGP